jgi:hypothetical protein
MSDSHPHRRDDIQAQKLESEWVLYDSSSGSLHVINEMAHFVWGLCDGSHSRTDMARRIAEGFEVPEGQDVEADLDRVLAQFGELGVLRDEG